MAPPSPLSQRGALQVAALSDTYSKCSDTYSAKCALKSPSNGLPPPPQKESPERWPPRRPFPPHQTSAPLSITGRSLISSEQPGLASSASAPHLDVDGTAQTPGSASRRVSRPSRTQQSSPSQPGSPSGSAGGSGAMMVVGESNSRQYDEELGALFSALGPMRVAKVGKACAPPWTSFLEDAYREYGCDRWGFDPTPLHSVVHSSAEGSPTWEEFRRWQHQWLSTLTTKDSSKAALLCWLVAEVRLANRIKEAAETCAGDDAGLISAIAAINQRGRVSKEASRVLEPVRDRLKKRMEEAAKAGDIEAWKQAAALALQADMSRAELSVAEAQMSAIREAKGITLTFMFPGGTRTSLRAFPRELVRELKVRLLAAKGSPQSAFVQMSVGSRLLEDDEPAARLEGMSPLLAVLAFDGTALASEAGRIIDSISRFKQAVAEVRSMTQPPVAVHVCCEVLACVLAGQESAIAGTTVQKILDCPQLRVPEDLSSFASFGPMLDSPGLYSLLKRLPALVAAGSVPEENFKAARLVLESTWQDSRGETAKLDRELLLRTSGFCSAMFEWLQMVLKYHDVVSP